MESQLVEAWRMSAEVNQFLLDNTPSTCLGAAYTARTRTVAGQFSHMHNVRIRWLKHAAPDLVADAETFARGSAPTKAELKKALRASEKAIARFLEHCERTGKVKSWKGSPATFLGYIVAHEAHHRGLAMVAIRLSGHRLPDEVTFGLWQWGMQRNLRGKKGRAR